MNEIIAMELSDMCYFFKQYFGTSENSYEIYLSTIDFLKHFNISEFNPQIKKKMYYRLLKKLRKRKRVNRLTYWWDKHFLTRKFK